MNEYELLRAEILHHFNAVTQYHSVMYTVAVAILTLGIQQKSVWLCWLPQAIVLIFELLCENKFRNTSNIGAYLYVFWEGETHNGAYNWERRNFNIVREGHSRLRMVWRTRLHYYVFLLISCVSAILMLLHDPQHYGIFRWLLVLLIVDITLIFCWIINDNTVTSKVRRDYIEMWRNVQRAEQESNTLHITTTIANHEGVLNDFYEYR